MKSPSGPPCRFQPRHSREGKDTQSFLIGNAPTRINRHNPDVPQMRPDVPLTQLSARSGPRTSGRMRGPTVPIHTVAGSLPCGSSRQCRFSDLVCPGPPAPPLLVREAACPNGSRLMLRCGPPDVVGSPGVVAGAARLCGCGPRQAPYRMPFRPMGMPSPSERCTELFLIGTHCGVCFTVSRSVAMKKLIQLGLTFMARPTEPPRLSMTV